MNQTPPTSRSDGFEDPRSRGDFLPQYYPKVNGRDAPPLDAAERNDRLALEFLAAYYDLNRAYAGLLQVRLEPATTQRQEAERKGLQAVERLLIMRDSLEDRYAPLGVIVEPVVEGGFTVNLIISFGNVDAAGRRRSEAYTITARVPIPWPEGIRLEDLRVKIEGPGINPQ
jgi:hypothetical protein